MVEASTFIPLVIVAITQMVKMAAPKVQDWVTIAVALVVAVVIALIDTLIGIADISVAQGVVFGLTAVGVTVLAGKAGGGSSGDGHVVAR